MFKKIALVLFLSSVSMVSLMSLVSALEVEKPRIKLNLGYNNQSNSFRDSGIFSTGSFLFSFKELSDFSFGLEAGYFNGYDSTSYSYTPSSNDVQSNYSSYKLWYAPLTLLIEYNFWKSAFVHVGPSLFFKKKIDNYSSSAYYSPTSVFNYSRNDSYNTTNIEYATMLGVGYSFEVKDYLAFDPEVRLYHDSDASIRMVYLLGLDIKL